MKQVDVDPLIYDPLFFMLSKSLSLKSPLHKQKRKFEWKTSSNCLNQKSLCDLG